MSLGLNIAAMKVVSEVVLYGKDGKEKIVITVAVVLVMVMRREVMSKSRVDFIIHNIYAWFSTKKKIINIYYSGLKKINFVDSDKKIYFM